MLGLAYLQERALPTLAGILSAPESHTPALLEGALDVLAALLRPATPDQAARVHAAVSSHVMALALSQDDPAVLQSCSEYLRRVHLGLFIPCACLDTARWLVNLQLLCMGHAPLGPSADMPPASAAHHDAKRKLLE